jgi:hypothetical protein
LKGKLADISKGDVDTEYRILAPLRRWFKIYGSKWQH